MCGCGVLYSHLTTRYITTHSTTRQEWSVPQHAIAAQCCAFLPFTRGPSQTQHAARIHTFLYSHTRPPSHTQARTSHRTCICTHTHTHTHTPDHTRHHAPVCLRDSPHHIIASFAWHVCAQLLELCLPRGVWNRVNVVCVSEPACTHTHASKVYIYTHTRTRDNICRSQETSRAPAGSCVPQGVCVCAVQTCVSCVCV